MNLTLISKSNAFAGLLRALVSATCLAAGWLAFGQTAPEQFDAFIKVEIAKWARVVKVSGAKAD